MSETPIKLFATRAEQYPEPTEIDVLQGTARAALAALPFVGGSITELLSMVLAPAVSKRRDTWFKDIADALEALQERIEGMSIEKLVQDDAFISATIQATRIALGTHQKDKLKALKNALMNVAIGTSLDEERQAFFIGLVDQFQATHFGLLRLFHNRVAFPPDRFNLLRSQRYFTDSIILDLNNHGLLIDPRPYAARNRESQDSLVIEAWTLSPLGNELLTFIELKKEIGNDISD